MNRPSHLRRTLFALAPSLLALPFACAQAPAYPTRAFRQPDFRTSWENSSSSRTNQAQRQCSAHGWRPVRRRTVTHFFLERFRPMPLSRVPTSSRATTAVSLVDVYPTILDWTGVASRAEERLLPGRALSQVAVTPDDHKRTVLSEYHAAGAISGVFMLRQGRLKYIDYTGCAAVLYDLHDDPEEMNDLSAHPAYASTIDRFRAMQLAHCNPQDVDRRAKPDQAALVDRHGGREAVLARGGGSYTPIPGEQPIFIKA